MNFDIVLNGKDENYILLIAMDGFLLNNAFYYKREELRYFDYILGDFLSQIDNSGIKKQGISEKIYEYNNIKIKDDRKYANKYLLMLFINESINYGYWLSLQELISLKFKIEKGLGVIGMVRARTNQ